MALYWACGQARGTVPRLARLLDSADETFAELADDRQERRRLTLADWAKRIDPEGRRSEVVELLAQSNNILSEMLGHEQRKAR